MDASDQPAEVHGVLDELHAGVSRRRVPGRVGNVVQREQHAGQGLERDRWRGQSNVLAALLSATDQPRCEQLIAKTSTLPEFLTTNPPKASSPGALSPPPSAMMNAVFGVRGASNLTASPSCSWSMGVCRATLTGPFFWPFGGAGQK